MINELPAQIGTFNDKVVKEYYAKCSIIPGCFFFTKVKESNVFMKLINLKSSIATGLDNIPLTFLKDSDNFITPMVTHKINLSIGQGKVPDELKQARVRF